MGHVAPSCTMLHHVAPCCTMLHHLAPSSTLLYHLAPSCTMLHHVAPPCTILHHVAPEYARVCQSLAMFCQSSAQVIPKSSPSCPQVVPKMSPSHHSHRSSPSSSPTIGIRKFSIINISIRI